MVVLNIVKKSRYLQYVAALSATLSISCYAMHSAWPSPILPGITSKDSPIGVTITHEEASWVASTSHLGSTFGGFVAGWLLSKTSRKTTLLISSGPMLISWIGIIFARSAVTLCIARFIAGIASGIVYTAVPIYIAEISEKDIRGKLGSTLNILSIIGGLYVFAVGPFVSYAVLAMSCGVFPLLFAIIFLFMPESPYYLVKINQKDKALKNLISLSAQNTDFKVVQAHLDEVENTVKHDMKNRSSLVELLVNPEYRHALIIMTGLKIIQQCTGGGAVAVYLQSIIQESKSGISPGVSSIIFGVMQIPGVLVAVLFVDKVGRKPLLILSAIGTAIGLLAEGAYFYLQATDYFNIDSLSWLPLSGVILLTVMKDVGLATLPYVIMSEVFPTNVKEQAVAIFICLGSITGFLVVKFFEPISSSWGMHVIFWIYAGVCILGIIFIMVVIPETKGKTFLEIQDALHRKKIMQPQKF